MKNLSFYYFYLKVILKFVFANLVFKIVYNNFDPVKSSFVLILIVLIYYVYLIFVKWFILKKYYAFRILIPVFSYKSLKIVKLFLLYIVKKVYFWLKKVITTFINTLMDTKKMDIFFRKYHLRFMMRVVWFYVGFINYTLLGYYNNYFRFYVEKLVNFYEKKIFLLDVKKYKFIYFIIFSIFLVLFFIKFKDVLYYNFLKSYFIYFEGSNTNGLLIKDFNDKNIIRFDCLKKRYFNYKDYRFLKFIDYSFLMYLIEMDICRYLGFDMDMNEDKILFKNLKIDDKDKYKASEEELAFYKGFFKIKYFFNKCFDMNLLQINKPSLISDILSKNWSRFSITNYFFKNDIQPFKHEFFYSSNFFPILNKELHEYLIDYFVSKKKRASREFKNNLAYYKIIRDNFLYRSKFFFPSKKEKLETIGFSLEKKFDNVNCIVLNKFFYFKDPLHIWGKKKIFGRRVHGAIKRFSRTFPVISANRRYTATKWNLFSWNSRFRFYKIEPFIFEKERDIALKYKNRTKFFDLILYRSFYNYKADNPKYILNSLAFKFKNFYNRRNYNDFVFQKQSDFDAQLDHFIFLKKTEQSRKLISFFYTFKNYKIDAKYRCLFYFYLENNNRGYKLNFFDKIFYEKLMGYKQDKSLLNVLEKRKETDSFLRKKEHSYTIPPVSNNFIVKFLDSFISFLINLLKAIFETLYVYILSKITFSNVWWLVKGIFNFSHFDNYIYGVKVKKLKDDHYWTENFYRRANTFSRVNIEKCFAKPSSLNYISERMRLRKFRNIKHYLMYKKSRQLFFNHSLTYSKSSEVSNYVDDYLFNKHYRKAKKTKSLAFEFRILKEKKSRSFWNWNRKKEWKHIKRYYNYKYPDWSLKRTKKLSNKLVSNDKNHSPVSSYKKIKDMFKKKN